MLTGNLVNGWIGIKDDGDSTRGITEDQNAFVTE